MSVENFIIRQALREDTGTILALMHEFAEYVKLTNYLVVDQQTLERQLFDNHAAEVLIGQVGPKPVGYTLYYSVFSSFTGRRGVFIDDLYISPSYRAQGYGKALLSALAQSSLKKGFTYLEWSCLNWNTSAIKFYQSIGAHPHDDSKVYRLDGSTLSSFAKDLII